MSSPGLPADVNRVLVQGQFLNLRGEAQTGAVTFTPNLTWTIDAANKQVITGVPITAPLDATGSFSIYLPCTDDTDLNPAIGSYMVVDPAGRAYNMLVPVGSGTIDLSEVVPAGPSTPGVVQLLVGPPGPAGSGATKLTELTDVTTTGAAVGKLPAVADVSPLSFSLMEYFRVLAGNPDLLLAGTITRDTNGAATSAPVVWPDGRPGVYTATTVSTAFPGAVDAYTITYDAAGADPDLTYTQPAVTRDTSGAVTARPAITVA